MSLLKSLINNIGYVSLIAVIISNLSVFKKMIYKDEFGKGDLVVLSMIFSIFGIMGTYIGTEVHGAIANTRIIGGHRRRNPMWSFCRDCIRHYSWDTPVSL